MWPLTSVAVRRRITSYNVCYTKLLRARHGIAIDRERLERLLPEVWREFGCASDPGRDRFRAHPGGSAGFWRDVLDRVAALAGIEPRPSRFAVV